MNANKSSKLIWLPITRLPHLDAKTPANPFDYQSIQLSFHEFQ